MATYSLHIIPLDDMNFGSVSNYWTNVPWVGEYHDGTGDGWNETGFNGEPVDFNFNFNATNAVQVNVTDNNGTLDDDTWTGFGPENSPESQAAWMADEQRFDDNQPDGSPFASFAGGVIQNEYEVQVTDGVNTYTMVAVSTADSSKVIGFTFDGPWPASDVQLTYIPNSNTDHETLENPEIPCFIAGTMIDTPEGEKPVEALAVGDTITTTSGDAVQVKWIGRKLIRNRSQLTDKASPVCISAGAFGEAIPHSDLYVSSDHGMIVDDIVVNAGAMVNGSTIRFVQLSEMPAEFTYYHIETENHEEIIANGAPAETFVDYVTRQSFDNFDEYLSLYGSERIIAEMQRTRISSRRQLPHALRKQLGVASFTDAVSADLERFMARAA